MMRIKETDKKKAWAEKTISTTRTAKNFAIRNTFIIYCEGQNTEPEYFKKFLTNTETKVEVIGLKKSRSDLVEEILEKLKKREFLKDQKEYDEDRQIWCVFDFDETKGKKGEAEDFNNAIKRAKNNNIRVAYSNDSFELWFVLHFQYLDSVLTRKGYYDILSEQFDLNYEKEGKESKVCEGYYKILSDKMETAISHALKLANSHEPGIEPSDQKPITKVHELVNKLKKCLKQ